MARSRIVTGIDDLVAMRSELHLAREHARKAIARILENEHFLDQMKFERLGCDPLDTNDPQNLVEQINQQATYEAGVDALEYLWSKHPGAIWRFAPGAHSNEQTYDIESDDGTVAAEVFAAVDPRNNKKLAQDQAKVAGFRGPHRYVIFRSPARPRKEEPGAVTVMSLGPPRDT